MKPSDQKDPLMFPQLHPIQTQNYKTTNKITICMNVDKSRKIQKNTEYLQTHQKTENNQKGQQHINSFNISYTSLHFIYFTF